MAALDEMAAAKERDAAIARNGEVWARTEARSPASFRNPTIGMAMAAMIQREGNY